MFNNFLLLFLRTLKSRGGYILLNLAGLAIGLTSFIFISLYVANELSFDRFHRNYQNVCRLKVVGHLAGGTLDQAVTAAPMAQTMLTDYPEVLKATRVTRLGAWLILLGEKRFNEDGLLFADSTFFDVFDFPLLKGDPKSALVRPRSMILTEKYARKYFGDTDPVGKTIGVESDTIQYTITGVMRDVPENSHIRFDILASNSTYGGNANSTAWLDHNFYTYIVVKGGTDLKALQKKFQDMVTRYVGPQIKQFVGITLEEFRKEGNDFGYVIEPLKDIHLKGATQYNLEPPGSISTVIIFAAIAVLILIVAIINYINLATAKAASRAREVGIRKVSGANRPELLFRFLGESLLITVFAAIVALLIVIALLPFFNHLTGQIITLNLVMNPAGIISFIGLILIVGLAAGFYPAFILASFNPAEVLKGTMSPGSMSVRLRSILVIIQYTVSIVIIIGSITVYQQLSFMTKKDLGFDKENLLVIRRPDAFWQRMDVFRTQLLEIPGVTGVGFSRAIPGSGTYNNNAFFNDDDPEKRTYLLNQARVSFDFPEALGVKLLAGRFYSRDFGTDSTAVILNEAAVKSLGLKEPIGKYILQPRGPQQFQKYKVIGIMKDFNIESMHKPIAPVCFIIDLPQGGDRFALVRLTGKDTPATLKSIEQVWQKFTATQPFQYDFFTDRWNSLYTSETRTGKIFIIFALLAVFIASIGLIGLVTYVTNKRTSEIGIRKTYGATSVEILKLLSVEFLLLIALASVLAWPMAFFGSRYWLGGFADRISVNPFIYILATLLTIALGWISISYQTSRAASLNPANALRIE